jgi:hypothetical protein
MNRPKWSSAPGMLLAVIAFLGSRSAPATLPVTGVPVPLLSVFDNSMQDFMTQNGIDDGVLAVSRNGVIIYQRGFGSLFRFPHDYDLPENTPFRLASCEKTLTAAAIRMLVDDWGLAWSTHLFNLGQPGGGVLPIAPWPSLGDSALRNVTVQDAFNHVGGWDRSRAAIGDPVFQAVTIANQMGISSPPGRDNTIRYMLGQPLDFPPGTMGCTDPGTGQPILCYSNFGYMVLGRVIEQWSGLSDIDFVRRYVLTPSMWVPSTEIFWGRTFSASQNFREPDYEGGSNCTNVFDPNGPPVECPYGNWDHESFIGFGNVVASAAPLLVYMDNYQVNVGGSCGTPLNGGAGGGVHSGTLDGQSSVMYQRDDHINIVVLFNRRGQNDSVHLAYTEAANIAFLIDGMIFNHLPFPTFEVDGFWTDFNANGSLQVGGYNAPFQSMATALANTTDGTKLRLKPGTSTWTGTINRFMRLDAPFGTARIGG